ncbi:DUF6458 family protein [Nakamurella endophytica]|uniref:DUF6458 domain-containing protein n=1 Tax=Nakamurella endophytica TaxID=1748367 RepID=A0A917T289_9ACTN|nr:DUF6458 family protein [Nakamurella endophytica]GGM07817.1 hypothetical protein GCM10011594_29750 [Nakamurella endophytica]
MVLGFGLALIVIGAILVFAVKADVSGFDIHTVGWILMGAGALLFVIGLALLIPRARRARSTAVTTDEFGRQYVTRREDRIDGV